MGGSRSVTGAAVRGDLGWRKLEERSKRADVWEGLEDNRLVKIVVAEKLSMLEMLDGGGI